MNIIKWLYQELTGYCWTHEWTYPNNKATHCRKCHAIRIDDQIIYPPNW